MDNNAMTLEEVKALKAGDWVWVTDDNRRKNGEYIKLICNVDNEKLYFIGEYFHVINYGKTWLCYRTQADAERKKCPICNDMGEITIKTRNGEIHLFPKYCPECGRKLHD